MKLTKSQQKKIIEITTLHDYDEKYMVVLNEGYENQDYEEGGIAFFNTIKEVKQYIDETVFIGA